MQFKLTLSVFLACVCLVNPAAMADGPHGKGDKNPTGVNTAEENNRLTKGYDSLAKLYEDIRCAYDKASPDLKGISKLEAEAGKLENATIPEATKITLPPTLTKILGPRPAREAAELLAARPFGKSERTYLWAGDYFTQKAEKAATSTPAPLSDNLLKAVRTQFDETISEKLDNTITKMIVTKAPDAEIEEQKRVNKNIEALFTDALSKEPDYFRFAIVDGKVRFQPTEHFAKLQIEQMNALAATSPKGEITLVSPPFIDPVGWYARFGESNSKQMAAFATRLPVPPNRGKLEAWVNASTKVLMPRSEVATACKSGGFHVAVPLPTALGKTAHFNLVKNDLERLNKQDPASPIQLSSAAATRLGVPQNTTSSALLARLNALATGPDPFTGDEVNTIWPGIHGAVGDSRELMTQFRATRSDYDARSKALGTAPVTISPAVAKALGVTGTTAPANTLDFTTKLHPSRSGLSEADYRTLGTAILAATAPVPTAVPTPTTTPTATPIPAPGAQCTCGPGWDGPTRVCVIRPPTGAPAFMAHTGDCAPVCNGALRAHMGNRCSAGVRLQ